MLLFLFAFGLEPFASPESPGPTAIMAFTVRGGRLDGGSDGAVPGSSHSTHGRHDPCRSPSSFPPSGLRHGSAEFGRVLVRSAFCAGGRLLFRRTHAFAAGQVSRRSSRAVDARGGRIRDGSIEPLAARAVVRALRRRTPSEMRGSVSKPRSPASAMRSSPPTSRAA